MSSSVAVAVFKTRLTTKLLRQFLFAISQFCRSVSDLTDEDVAAASPFHSVDEPAVELPDYALSVARSLHFNKQTVFLAMAYLSLYSQKSGRLPSILSVHRLFASALLLATRTSQPDSSVADVSFASASGLSVSELLDLVAILRRIVGTADVPDDVLSTFFARLEDASSKTLRRDITEAVACAFQVSLPRTRKNNHSVALVFPKSPCTAASTPNNSDSGWWLSAGSSNHSSFYTLQGSSTHSSFHHAPSSPAHDAHESSSGSFAAGSASSAARSLRRHLSSDSVVVTVTPPILPLPTFEQLRLEPEVPVVIPPTPPTSGRSGIVRLPPSFGRR